MVHPTGYMRKEGVIAAQDQHLGRTYVSELYPVPVYDDVTGSQILPSVNLVQLGSLVDIGSQDHASGGIGGVAVVLYTPSMYVEDTIHGGLLSVACGLRTPQIDAKTDEDHIWSTGVLLDGVQLRVSNITPPSIPDDINSVGISSVAVSIITN